MKHLQAKDITQGTSECEILLERLLEIEDQLEAELKEASTSLVPTSKIEEARRLAKHLKGNGFQTETFFDKGVPTVIVSRHTKDMTLTLDRVQSVLHHPLVCIPLLGLVLTIFGVEGLAAIILYILVEALRRFFNGF